MKSSVFYKKFIIHIFQKVKLPDKVFPICVKYYIDEPHLFLILDIVNLYYNKFSNQVWFSKSNNKNVQYND